MSQVSVIRLRFLSWSLGKYLLISKCLLIPNHNFLCGACLITMEYFQDTLYSSLPKDGTQNQVFVFHHPECLSHSFISCGACKLIWRWNSKQEAIQEGSFVSFQEVTELCGNGFANCGHYHIWFLLFAMNLLNQSFNYLRFKRGIKYIRD